MRNCLTILKNILFIGFTLFAILFANADSCASFIDEVKYQKYLSKVVASIKAQRQADPTQFIFDMREAKSEARKLCDAPGVNSTLNEFYNSEPKTLAYYVLLIDTDWHLFYDTEEYEKAFSLKKDEIQLADVERLKTEVRNIKDRFNKDVAEKAMNGEDFKYIILTVYNFYYSYNEAEMGWRIDPMTYFDQLLDASFTNDFYSKCHVTVGSANGVTCETNKQMCAVIGDQTNQVVAVLHDMKNVEHKNFLTLLPLLKEPDQIISVVNRLSFFNIEKIDPQLRLNLLTKLSSIPLKENNGGEQAAVKLLQFVKNQDAGQVLEGLNKNLLLFNLLATLDDEGPGEANYTKAVFVIYSLIQQITPYDGNIDKLLQDNRIYRWNGDGFFDGTNFTFNLRSDKGVQDGKIYAIIRNGDLNYEETSFDPFGPVGILSNKTLPGIDMQKQGNNYVGVVPGLYLYWMLDKKGTKDLKIIGATGVNLLALVTGAGLAVNAQGWVVRIIGTCDVLAASTAIALDLTPVESKIIEVYGEDGRKWVDNIKTILFIYNAVSGGANLLKLPQKLDDAIVFYFKNRKDMLNRNLLTKQQTEQLDKLLESKILVDKVDDAVIKGSAKISVYSSSVDNILTNSEFFPSVVNNSGKADDILFDPVKLERIAKSLEKQGVAVWMGEDAERFLKQMGAEAMYWDNLPGRPGTLVFPRNPTRAQVIEELKHLGQHRKRLWSEAGGYQNIVKIEIQTQEELIEFGKKNKWNLGEIKKLEDALNYWLNELEVIEKK